MSFHVSIAIKGNIDAIMLWRIIECYHVNLTDLGDVTYVYGDVAPHSVGELVSRCALFGDLQVEIKGGGHDEQKETAESET